MHNLKFPVTTATGASQNCQKSPFSVVFFSIKCSNFTMDWDKVKGFSGLVLCYLKIYFLAPHKSKIFLTMRGGYRPLQTPSNRRGHIPPLEPPCRTLLKGGAQKKLSFLNNFSQTENSVWAYIGQCVTIWGLKGGGWKAAKTRL
jgi:hypothetical protein